VSQAIEPLGVGAARQVAPGVKHQVVEAKAVEPQQPVGLVEPVLAPGRRGGHPVERRARDRLKRAEVGPRQAQITVQPPGRGQDLLVRFAGRPDDKLRRLPGGSEDTPPLSPPLRQRGGILAQ